jgi:hypothetical protein
MRTLPSVLCGLVLASLGTAEAFGAGDFLSGQPVLEWSRPLPGTQVGGLFHTERAPPAVHNGVLYLGAAGGNGLFAMELNSGGLKHQYPSESAVFSAPIFNGDDLYFSDSAGYTYRFEIGANTPTWSHFGGVPIGSTPSLSGSALFVATVDDLVFAIHKETGETIWRYQHPADATRKSELTLFGAPNPVVLENEVLFGFSDGSLVALDSESGQPVWERQIGQGRYPDLIATPVVADNDIYLGAFSEPFVALDKVSHSPRWSLELGSSAAVAVVGEMLYLGGSDGQMRAIERKTGEQTWAWDSQTSGALSAPQITPAGVAVASSDGGLYLVDANSGTLVWSYQPDHHLAGISATPLISGDRLIAVSNGGQLLCFRAVQDSPLPADWLKWDWF